MQDSSSGVSNDRLVNTECSGSVTNLQQGQHPQLVDCDEVNRRP